MISDISPSFLPVTDHILDINYREWLPENRAAKIIDIGCGDGRVLTYLSKLGYTNILGVDRDEVVLKNVGTLPGVSVEYSDVGTDFLSNYQGQFDVIILKQMIYYFPRQQVLSFIKSVKEALTPDGIVIIEIFNATLFSSRFTELKDPFILTAYTEHSIRRILEAAGLNVISVTGEKRHVTKLRSTLYALARALWVSILKLIYVLERGIDNEFPRIYTKSIIAIARLGSVK